MSPPIELPPLPPFTPAPQPPVKREPGGHYIDLITVISLRDEAAMDHSGVHSSYVAGLRGMPNFDRDERYRAPKHLREVVMSADGSWQASAILLAALVSMEFGDSFLLMPSKSTSPKTIHLTHLLRSMSRAARLVVSFDRGGWGGPRASCTANAVISRPLIAFISCARHRFGYRHNSLQRPRRWR
jgi:hypothetical protein